MTLTILRPDIDTRPLLESERLGLAAHLHVALRRKLGRVTDVEWLTRDAAYAREILALARDCGHADVQECGRKLELALAPLLRRPVAEMPPRPPASPRELLEQRYVGRLR
ncbi:hypothetical protein [Aquabacterium sp. OR-4]|uniref:hypothetical protein n=1 Tax=Aquabacterium sp. OR-4 TaxID=2978127 RepID=UPI0021B236DC|nr:hypothetical protein [Aquabacterium sp. OR-4]MDT7834668.1 hypothetical protein [Aquabacterium sp. OR-4]